MTPPEAVTPDEGAAAAAAATAAARPAEAATPAGPATPAEPATPPPPPGRALRVGRVLVVVGLVVAYVVVLVAYARSTVDTGVSVQPEPPRDGVAVTFLPTAIDPSARVLGGLLFVVPGGDLVDADGRLRQDLSVDVYPVLGSASEVLPAGRVPAPLSLQVSLDGNVLDYPFDSYRTDLLTSVSVGSGAQRRALPTVVGAEGDLGGWVLSFGAPAEASVAGATYTTADGYGIEALGARRAASTVAIALLVLGLMVLLAVLAAAVARAVALRRRRVEPSLAGWMGAMLFALVPLRNFLPGAPPLGAWIDVLVFFWVEIVIMVALAAYAATWLRDGPPSDRAG